MAQTDTTKSRRASWGRRAIVAVFLGAAVAVAGLARIPWAGPTGATEWQQTDPKTMSAREQYEKGRDYALGIGGVKKDLEEAAKWYRLAAERGYVEAQNSLGSCYHFGQGVGKDKKDAAKWYRLAAEQGNGISQYFLGQMYRDGDGVPQDRDEALKWLRLAAQNDSNIKSVLKGAKKEYLEMGGEKSLLNQTDATQMSAHQQFEKGGEHFRKSGAKNEQEAAKWYRLAAERGHAEAQQRLGYLYYYGQGVDKDWSESAKWYRLAAEQGDGQALNELGHIYYSGGNGVVKDYAEAAKWYRLAAERGDEFAKKRLIDMVKSGEGVVAAQADQMSADEQYAMGEKYNYGWSGVKKDYKEAAKWYRLASERGHTNAQSQLGRIYFYGEETIGKDHKEAAKWFRLAAAQGDKFAKECLVKMAENGSAGVEWQADQMSSDEQYAMGKKYDYGTVVAKDYKEAAKWFRLAADRGHAEAQYDLGRSYYMGRGVREDKNEAAKWYRLAAAQGHKDAKESLNNIELVQSLNALTQDVNQIETGRKYYLGEGVAKDHAEAAKWYRQAAERGNAEGQCLLGCMYLSGEGVAQDNREAAKWFRKAADQGDDYGQHFLGLMYAAGVGVAQNNQEAIKWLRKSADQGNEDAKQALADMTRPQAPKRSAQDWLEIAQQFLGAVANAAGEYDKVQQARRGGQGARGASGGGETEPCGACNSSGMCTVCYGHSSAAIGKCPLCNNTGVCSFCGGTKRRPKGSGGWSSGSSSSGSSSSDRREDCPVCLGLKRCPNKDCRDGWVHKSAASSEVRECTTCRGSGFCYKCKGTGKK